MTRKDFATKFLELMNTTKVGGDTCFCMMYKYPSGRFCISLDSYHTNQTYVRVQGANLSALISKALKEVEQYNHRHNAFQEFDNKVSFGSPLERRPAGLTLTDEQIGIVAKGLREVRKRKVKK